MRWGLFFVGLWLCGTGVAVERASWVEEALASSSLLLEVEALGSSVAGEPASDLVWATVDWETFFSSGEGLQWHVGLLWEQDSREEDPLDRLSVRGEWNQLGLTVGRFYQPVGRFDSMFISDPLTLELGELNQTSVMVDAQLGSLLAQAGLFRSSLGVEDEQGLEEGYAALTWELRESVVVGGYWLNNLLETDGLVELGSALVDADHVVSAAGWGGFVAVEAGDIRVNADWLGAVDSVHGGARDGQPSAWQVECGCVWGEHWSAGVRFERSDEFFAGYELGEWMDAFAEQRIGAAVAYAFEAGLSCCLEVMQLTFADGSEGERAAVQVAQSF